MIDPIAMAISIALASPTASMVCVLPSSYEQDAPQQQDDAGQAVEKLIEEFDAEQMAFYEKLDNIESDNERVEFYQSGRPDAAPYCQKLRAIAEQNAETEAAAKAASWVLSNAQGDNRDWAVETLLSDFIDSEHIDRLPFALQAMTTPNIAALEKVRKQSSNKRVRAMADFVRAGQLMNMGKAALELDTPGSSGDPYITYYLQGIDDALKAKLMAKGMSEECTRLGEELYTHCAKAYADIEIYPDSGMMVGAMAGGALFELKNLQIGMVAPDIHGEDADGVAFNLYDYRGRVILLDFWGYW